MTAPELRAWIDSLTQVIDFAYRGKIGSICPFHREDIALCYDGYAVDAHSVDEAMALPQPKVSNFTSLMMSSSIFR